MASLITGNAFDPNKDIPDLSGKVYIVTGGSSGIGYGIVAHLLQHGAKKIYLLSMKENHAEETMQTLKDWGHVQEVVEWRQCNLEDLHMTQNVAKSLASELTQLDGLVCNAGLGVGVYNETKDGIDSHFQVNFLSQFHLAMILLPLLQKTPHSRLVLQSSDLHRSARSSDKFESLAEINTDIGPTNLYNRSKLAQVLFVRALARRIENGELGTETSKASGPWVNATHPGGVKTDQQKQAVDAYGTLGKIGANLIKPLMKDAVDEGCRPALFAATSLDILDDKVQGKYIVPDRKVTDPSKQAQDDALGEQLLRLTEQILTEKLGSLPYPSLVRSA